MASTTTNLGLTLPVESENYDLDVVNGNNQIIDEAMGDVETALEEINQASVSDTIAAVDAINGEVI